MILKKATSHMLHIGPENLDESSPVFRYDPRGDRKRDGEAREWS